jgi:hypothetical protein
MKRRACLSVLARGRVGGARVGLVMRGVGGEEALTDDLLADGLRIVHSPVAPSPTEANRALHGASNPLLSSWK